MKNQRNFSKTCFQSVSDKTFILLGQNTSSQIDLVFYWKSFGKISQNVRFYYQTADYIDVIDGCWWRLWPFDPRHPLSITILALTFKNVYQMQITNITMSPTSLSDRDHLIFERFERFERFFSIDHLIINYPKWIVFVWTVYMFIYIFSNVI